MMRRLQKLALLSVLLVSMLSGMAMAHSLDDAASRGAGELKANAQKRDTLLLWAMDSGVNSGSALQKIARRFSHRAGIAVKVRFLDWGTAFEQLSRTLSLDSAAAVKAGLEIPDVIQLGSSWVPYFAKQGLVSPLSRDLLEQLDSTRFLPAAMKVSHVGEDTMTYSLPWFLDVRGLFANKRLWDDLSISTDEISTFPKFYGFLRAFASRKTKNSAGQLVSPFEYAALNDWTAHQQMAPILWSFGGDIVRKCGNGYCSGLADSSTLVGLAHYLKFLSDGEIAPYSLRENSTQSADRFVRSEQLMIYGTTELIRKMDFGGELGGLKGSLIGDDGITLLPFPKGPAGNFTFVGGSHLALPINGFGHKRKAALDLYMYLLRADNVDTYSRQVGFIPADKSLISIWSQDSRYNLLIENLDATGRSFLNIPEWSQVEMEIKTMVNSMVRLFANNTPDGPELMMNLVLTAHLNINKILGYTSTESSDEVLHRITTLLGAPVPESASSLTIVSKDGNDEMSLGSVKFHIAAFAATSILLSAAIVMVFRRKRE